MWGTFLGKTSRFLNAWIEVKIIDLMKNFVEKFSTQALTAAIENNIDITPILIPAILPSDAEERKRYTDIIKGALESISEQRLMELLEEAVPAYAKLLKENPEWWMRQLSLAKEML